MYEEDACRGGSGVVLGRVERSDIRCPFRKMSTVLGKVSKKHSNVEEPIGLGRFTVV